MRAPLLGSLLILGAAAAGLGVLTARTKRRPGADLPDLAGFARIWQVQHRAADVDPLAHPVLRRYLAVVHRAARPPARAGLHPDVVTAWGAWLALCVPVLALGTREIRAPRGWGFRVGALSCALAVLVSVAADSIDGAVAGMTGRGTRHGFVLDSLADRLSDGAILAALVIAGWPEGPRGSASPAAGLAPSPAAATVPACLWVAVGAWTALLALEYLRARASIVPHDAAATPPAPDAVPGARDAPDGNGHAAIGEIGVVTAGERPTRVIVAIFGFVGIALLPGHRERLATLTLATVTAVCIVGLVQLGRHVFGGSPRSPDRSRRTHEPGDDAGRQ